MHKPTITGTSVSAVQPKKNYIQEKRGYAKNRVETSASGGMPSRRAEPVPIVVAAPRGMYLQRVLRGLLGALHCVALHGPLWQEVVAVHKPGE